MKELHYESCCFTKAERNTTSIPAHDFLAHFRICSREPMTLSTAYPLLGFYLGTYQLQITH